MDRINLNCMKFHLFGRSEQWKAYREQAILDIKACWQARSKYFEPSGTADYFQLYDSWNQNDIYNGYCKFAVDAADERFTVGLVWARPASQPGVPFDDFDELIAAWRHKLSDPTISITPADADPLPPP